MENDITIDIINNKEVFMVTIKTNVLKLSTGYAGLRNYYAMTGGLIQLSETTYNGMLLTVDEKEKFYKYIMDHDGEKKLNNGLS